MEMVTFTVYNNQDLHAYERMKAAQKRRAEIAEEHKMMEFVVLAQNNLPCGLFSSFEEAESFRLREAHPGLQLTVVPYKQAEPMLNARQRRRADLMRSDLLWGRR